MSSHLQVYADSGLQGRAIRTYGCGTKSTTLQQVATTFTGRVKKEGSLQNTHFGSKNVVIAENHVIQLFCWLR